MITYVSVKVYRVPQLTYPKTSHHIAAKARHKRPKADEGSSSMSKGNQENEGQRCRPF